MRDREQKTSGGTSGGSQSQDHEVGSAGGDRMLQHKMLQRAKHRHGEGHGHHAHGHAAGAHAAAAPQTADGLVGEAVTQLNASCDMLEKQLAETKDDEVGNSDLAMMAQGGVDYMVQTVEPLLEKAVAATEQGGGAQADPARLNALMDAWLRWSAIVRSSKIPLDHSATTAVLNLITRLQGDVPAGAPAK